MGFNSAFKGLTCSLSSRMYIHFQPAHPFLSKIHLLYPPSMSRSSRCPYFRFLSPKVCLNSLLYPLRDTCTTDLTFLDIIIAMISGELFKSFGYSLCIFLPRPVTSFQLGPNIFLTILFPRHIFPLNPLNAELNPICHLLALLGAHHILHVSRIRVKCDRKRSCLL